LRRSFARVSDDQRIQAVIIAFSFGALLEALAGFGTPPAICSVMLVGLGLSPIRAVAVALVAGTFAYASVHRFAPHMRGAPAAAVVRPPSPPFALATAAPPARRRVAS